MASESKVYIALVSGAEVCYALGSNHLTTVADKEWLEKSEQRAGGGAFLITKHYQKNSDWNFNPKSPLYIICRAFLSRKGDAF